MLQELAIEIGAHGQNDRAGAGPGGLEQKVDELGDVALGQLGLKRRVAQGLGIEFLPLVDMQQEPIGAGLLGGGEKAADAAAGA